MDTIGKRIKFIREKLGLNQSQLAKEIGLESAMAISKYESDQREPDISKLIKLSELGNTSLDWLLTGADIIVRKGDETVCIEAKPSGVAEKDDPYYYDVREDLELSEIIDILQHDLPEAKKFVLKILKGRKEIKEGVEGLSGLDRKIIKEEG